MVHVGAVDAPVTIDDISTAMEECLKLKRTELHILGWEWEMGLYDLMTKEASKRGIKLVLLQIPREVMERQAVEQEDIKFFELAYLEIAIEKPKVAKSEIVGIMSWRTRPNAVYVFREPMKLRR